MSSLPSLTFSKSFWLMHSLFQRTHVLSQGFPIYFSIIMIVFGCHAAFGKQFSASIQHANTEGK